ncbi:MAG: hypothetical protein A2V53_02830 [Deltaproteobacteria bacterium RBG_19FT_COMBO_56_10]|nr:MAG: hypothetical protein A2V53_02830 [Deltaproteobacteria bacterium RBG_19FT_COMBO_56_10]
MMDTMFFLYYNPAILIIEYRSRKAPSTFLKGQREIAGQVRMNLVIYACSADKRFKPPGA